MIFLYILVCMCVCFFLSCFLLISLSLYLCFCAKPLKHLTLLLLDKYKHKLPYCMCVCSEQFQRYMQQLQVKEKMEIKSIVNVVLEKKNCDGKVWSQRIFSNTPTFLTLSRRCHCSCGHIRQYTHQVCVDQFYAVSNGIWCVPIIQSYQFNVRTMVHSVYIL